MTDALEEITALLSDVAESVDDDHRDPAERVKAYGRAERARGVALAFQAAHEAHEADGTDDGTEGFADRLRHAVDALRGRQTGAVETEADAALDDLAATVDETADVITDHADVLGEELANSHGGGEHERMFQ